MDHCCAKLRSTTHLTFQLAKGVHALQRAESSRVQLVHSRTPTGLTQFVKSNCISSREPKMEQNKKKKKWRIDKKTASTSCLEALLNCTWSWGEVLRRSENSLIERVSHSDRAQVTAMFYAWVRQERLDIKRTIRYSRLHIQLNKATLYECLCRSIKQT